MSVWLAGCWHAGVAQCAVFGDKFVRRQHLILLRLIILAMGPCLATTTPHLPRTAVQCASLRDQAPGCTAWWGSALRRSCLDNADRYGMSTRNAEWRRTRGYRIACGSCPPRPASGTSSTIVLHSFGRITVGDCVYLHVHRPTLHLGLGVSGHACDGSSTFLRVPT